MCVFFLFVIDLQEANDSLKCFAEEQNAHDSMTGTSDSSACMSRYYKQNNCTDNFYRRCTCMYTDEISPKKHFAQWALCKIIATALVAIVPYSTH